MNQALASRFRHKPIRYSILLPLLLTLAVSGCRESSDSYKEMMQAVGSLQVGMSRQEAEAYLEGAASHWRCAFDESASEELYLFGSDNLEKSDTIWVLYDLVLCNLNNVTKH